MNTTLSEKAKKFAKATGRPTKIQGGPKNWHNLFVRLNFIRY